MQLFKRKLKKYRIEYLAQCGWGVSLEEFICEAKSKRCAHKIWLDSGLYGLYEDREKAKIFLYKMSDIHLIRKDK